MATEILGVTWMLQNIYDVCNFLQPFMWQFNMTSVEMYANLFCSSAYITHCMSYSQVHTSSVASFLRVLELAPQGCVFYFLQHFNLMHTRSIPLLFIIWNGLHGSRLPETVAVEL